MKIKNTVTNLDVAPIPYPVKFNRKTHYQLFVCGILSIVLWIVVFLLSLDKLISIFQKKQMSLSSLSYRSWSKIQMNDINLNLIIQKKDNNELITKDNQFSNGLNITYSVYSKPEGSDYEAENYPLDSQSFNFFFPSDFQPIVTGNTLIESSEQKMYFEIQLRFCNEEADEKCKKISKDAHFNVKLTWNKPILNLQRDSDPISMAEEDDFQTIQMDSLDDEKRRKIFYIQGVNMSIDNSIFPTIAPFSSEDNFQTWFYGENTATSSLNLIEKDIILQSYSFRRDAETSQYQKRFKKLDTGIAEVLGIFSIVSLVMMLGSSHYKNWAKNVHLVETLNKREEEEKKANMKNYIKYIRNQNGDKEEMKKEFEQMEERLDIIQMRAEIDYLNEKMAEICSRLKIAIEKPQLKKEGDGEEEMSENDMKSSLLKSS